MNKKKSDEKYMQQAIDLAKQANPSPNPQVGCLIVKDSQIISEGHHKQAGENHAEINAIQNTSEDLSGATIYITLEPCNHNGKTPPCVDQIIEQGFSRVVISMKDPNKVNGSGLQQLRDAEIDLEVGILKEKAKELNREWIKYITQDNPFVYLKAAQTIDGKIACNNGASKWITGEQARREVHKLRSRVDAILVGKNTVQNDNPKLTARLDDTTYPTRVILGDKSKLDSDLTIFNEPGENLFFSQKELKETLSELADQGITSVLIEGGADVFTQFIEQDLVDEYWFFLAPKLLGEGLCVFQGEEKQSIRDSLNLEFISIEQIENDVLLKAKPN